MKKHHFLLTLGLLTIGGALAYEYYQHKKGGCGCGCGGKCKGKKTATTPATTATPTPVIASSTPMIPTTGMPEMDDIINPKSSSWNSFYGGNDGAGIVDTVKHMVVGNKPAGPSAVYHQALNQ